ncbi:hypothetical protein L0F63_005891 [Massospora cicadina]|nr:hypothetical protein L0F63_005891 [Massospora cicadina]
MFQIQDMLCTVVDLEAMVVLVLDGVDLVIVDSEVAVAAADSEVAVAAADSEVVVGGVVGDQPSLTTPVVTIKSASMMNRKC